MNERDVVKGIAHSLRKSHAEIARKVGISQSGLTQLLNGDTPLRADRLSAICDAIGAELCIIKGQKKYVIHNGEVEIERID